MPPLAGPTPVTPSAPHLSRPRHLSCSHWLHRHLSRPHLSRPRHLSHPHLSHSRHVSCPHWPTCVTPSAAHLSHTRHVSHRQWPGCELREGVRGQAHLHVLAHRGVGAYTRPLLSSTYAVLVAPPRVPPSNRLGGNHAPNVSNQTCLR
jgi:hypothetical protein